MSIYTLPPAPVGHEYGEYPWIDWWNKVRLSASSGAAALAGLDAKLNKDAADVLNGEITFDTLGAFKVGTVTWDGATATGTGVLFTQYGIVGANTGAIKFVIKSDGTATFAGNLSAATGTYVGKIQSVSGTNFLDFSATGTDSYLFGPGVDINADGTFTFGTTATKRLIWDGTDLTIESSSKLGTTLVSTVVTGAANGTTALAALTTKLDKNALYVMEASSEFQTSGYAGGNGMVFTNNGILAKKAGVNTFVIANDGTATFAGALSAATGTFAGSLSAATGTFAGSLSAATGTFAGSLSAASGSFTGSLTAATGTFEGVVRNTAGTRYIDFSATSTNPYLVAPGVLVNADGTFTFGTTSTKRLVWNGTNLTLEGSSLLDGTAVSTVVSNAATGAAEAGAYTLAASKLAKAGGDTLTGIIDLQVTSNYNAGIRVGSVTWDTSTGAITGGTGIVMTRKGLIGVASGTPTFNIDTATGAATFAGDITGSTGTFNGIIQTSTLTNGRVTLNESAGNFLSVYNTSGSSIFGLTGVSGSYTNMTYAGNSSVLGALYLTNVGTAPTIYAVASGGGYAIQTTGDIYASGYTVTANSFAGKATKAIELETTTSGTHTYTFSGGGVTGAATATFSGTNKPGSNSSNSWLAMVIDGNTYYIPFWT